MRRLSASRLLEGIRRIPKRNLASVILVIATLAAGMFLVFLSASPQVNLVGEQTLEGTAPVGTTVVTVDSPPSGLILANVTQGPCGLSIFLLGEAEWNVYNSSGFLPQEILDCENLMRSYTDEISHAVVVNQRGLDSDYQVVITFYQVNSPFAILSLPALILTLVGGIGALLLVLRRGFERITELVSERDKKQK